MIVAADYRLMPESNGSDIMEDLSEFWTWVREGLQGHLSKARPGIEADLEKDHCLWESEGGTLTIQSGFVQPPGFIKAVIATYPGLNLGVKRTVPIMGAPTIPPNILENFLKTIEPGKIVSSAEPPARFHIALSVAQQGRTFEFLGSGRELVPGVSLADS